MTPSVSDGRDAWRGQRALETESAGCATVARNADRGARLGSPGDAPRKRYLYTSLRFFLGINMTTECCLSTTTARLEGVNRPCGRQSGRGGTGGVGDVPITALAGPIAARRTRRPARRARRARRRAAVGRGRRRAQGRPRDVPWRCADVKGLTRRSTQPLGACAMRSEKVECRMLRGAARHRPERLGTQTLYPRAAPSPC